MNPTTKMIIGLLCGVAAGQATATAKSPNVLLIITDDHGYGDLGVNGNPVIRTPNIDRLANDGVRLTNFYVSPVCTPTRASLMTGRYNYRTRAVDTYRGRAMMDPAEQTIAEILGAAGYWTGIFGKWHLGDNYPMRPMDQGFVESLVHRGGGLAQPAGPPGEGYFNPQLWRSGKPESTKGYCTDLFADGASDFIRKNKDKPWFAYLAFNCPHDPAQVADESTAAYRGSVLDPVLMPPNGPPQQREHIARLYAMITGVDAAVGRVLSTIHELGLDDDTIVVFMTDNGPTGGRYNAGLRGRKGTVYEGGIRVPCFVRWPGKLRAGRKVEDCAAHIDLTPTLLAACGVALPSGLRLDGVTLWPLLQGREASLSPRNLFFQWHRGDAPQRGRAFAVRAPRWKLVQSAGVQPGEFDAAKAPVELFDVKADPQETKNLADAFPDVVKDLRNAYDLWFDEAASHSFDPPRIVIGTPHESPTRLTRQDWRGPEAEWTRRSVGFWEIHAAESGKYSFDVLFESSVKEASPILRVADREIPLKPSTSDPLRASARDVELSAGPTRLESSARNEQGRIGAYFIEASRSQ